MFVELKTRNKKGIISKELVYWVLALMLLAVGIYFLVMLISKGDQLENFDPEKNNFDEDAINDAFDPCPCGSPPNELNLRINIRGINICVLNYGTCPAEKKAADFKEETDLRGRTVCVYRKTDCLKYIEELMKKNEPEEK